MSRENIRVIDSTHCIYEKCVEEAETQSTTILKILTMLKESLYFVKCKLYEISEVDSKHKSSQWILTNVSCYREAKKVNLSLC
jgi:hypothetical protein